MDERILKELRGIRKALQAFVAIQRADVRRISKFEREAAREAKAAKEEARNLTRIREQRSTSDWIRPCHVEEVDADEQGPFA